MRLFCDSVDVIAETSYYEIVLRFHVKIYDILFTTPQNLPDNMAPTLSDRLDPVTQGARYLYNCITKNKYFFTFAGRGSPEEEEFNDLGLIQPYFADFQPECPLGRPLNHSENSRTLLPIPKLLHANSLDRNQYPWNVLRSGPDGWLWDRQRHRIYEQLNVAAYKAERSTLVDPTVAQSAMSTVTAFAQQSSYP